jgi:hypothetical protein
MSLHYFLYKLPDKYSLGVMTPKIIIQLLICIFDMSKLFPFSDICDVIFFSFYLILF